MAFYKNVLKYADVAAATQRLVDELRATRGVKEIKHPEASQEQYLFSLHFLPQNAKDGSQALVEAYMPMWYSGYTQIYPSESGYMLLISDDNRRGITVSKTHIRLPKLSHLITLIPEDFFTLLNLIATAAPAPPTYNYLSLRTAQCGVHNLETHNLSLFFTRAVTNYKINPEIANPKWLPLKSIKQMATLTPTLTHQLQVMQYFTALQNEDVYYFPLETALELELSPIEEMVDGYCIPSQDWA